MPEEYHHLFADEEDDKRKFKAEGKKKTKVIKRTTTITKVTPKQTKDCFETSSLKSSAVSLRSEPPGDFSDLAKQVTDKFEMKKTFVASQQILARSLTF